MNLESKLNGFRKIAVDEATKQSESIIARADAEYAEVCASFRVNAETKYRKKAAEEMLSLERLKNRKLLEASSQCKKEIMALRKQLLEEVEKNVEERLKRYVMTTEYKAELLDEINDVRWDRGATVIYLTRNDLEYIRTYVKDPNLAFEELDEDFIGGYKMRYAENMIIDNTYKTRFSKIVSEISIFQM